MCTIRTLKCDLFVWPWFQFIFVNRSCFTGKCPMYIVIIVGKHGHNRNRKPRLAPLCKQLFFFCKFTFFTPVVVCGWGRGPILYWICNSNVIVTLVVVAAVATVAATVIAIFLADSHEKEINSGGEGEKVRDWTATHYSTFVAQHQIHTAEDDRQIGFTLRCSDLATSERRGCFG